MALFTTGLIENTPVAGVRPSATVAVLLTNDNGVPIDVQINGFLVSGTTKTQYVAELFALEPGAVAIRNYSTAEFDIFEYQFVFDFLGMEISVWGKDAAGNLSFAQRIVPQELNLAGG